MVEMMTIRHPKTVARGAEDVSSRASPNVIAMKEADVAAGTVRTTGVHSLYVDCVRSVSISYRNTQVTIRLNPHYLPYGYAAS